MRRSNLFTAKMGMVFFLCFVMLSGCTALTGSAKWSCFDQEAGEGKECRNLYDERFTRVLEGSTASIDFAAAEFNEKVTVDKLCAAIKADGYDIALKAPENTMAWLNELLTGPGFFEKVLEKKEMIAYTAEIKTLVSLTNRYRAKKSAALTEEEQTNIKRLNRLLIESIYAQQSPKAKYIIAVKSKIFPTQEEKKEYLENRKKDNKTSAGYENFQYSIFEIDIDCLRRLYRTQGQFDYDGNDGKLEGQVFPFSDWVPIDASTELILQRECRPSSGVNK